MNITKLRLKNFKRVGGQFTEIKIEPGLNLIKSDINGVGKTTLLSASYFCLFGKSSDTKGSNKTTIPTSRLINDINKKDMMTEVYFDNGYVIRRGLKPDIFEIIDTEGNNLADKSSKTIDQTFLENDLLGFNAETFMSTIFLNSKPNSVPFLYMTNNQRKEYIEKILDLRIIYFLNESLKSKFTLNKLAITDNEKQLSWTKQQLQVQESELARNKQQYQLQLQEIESFNVTQENNINKLLEEIKSNESLIKENASKIQELESGIVKVQQMKEYAESDVAVANTDLDAIQKSYNETEITIQKDALKKTQEKVQILKAEMLKRQSLKTAYEENKSRYHFCGTCETLDKITGGFDYEGYNTFISQSAEVGTQLQNSIKDLESKIESSELFKNKIQEKKDILTKAKTDLSTIENQLNILVNNKSNIEASTNGTRNNIEKIKENIERIKTQVPPTLITINEQPVLDLKETITKLEKEYDILSNQKQELEELKGSINDKDLKENALKTYIPLFESKVNSLIDRFTEDDSFTINATIDDNFDINFTKNGKSLDVFSLSEGQKASITFAFTFAFQYLLDTKNAIPFKMLMIDEILDIALSNSRLEAIIQYLKEVSQDKPVYIISHNPNIQLEYFDNIIHVDLEDGFSRYSWE